MCFSAGHEVTFPFSRKRTNEVISSLFIFIKSLQHKTWFIYIWQVIIENEENIVHVQSVFLGHENDANCYRQIGSIHGRICVSLLDMRWHFLFLESEQMKWSHLYLHRLQVYIVVSAWLWQTTTVWINTVSKRSLNWINSMQVKKILFINVFFSWSLCLLNMFPSMVFPKHLYFSVCWHNRSSLWISFHYPKK
jgi:hypothetical protein